MSGRTRRRGQPLITLGLLLVGWTGVRAALWETPFPPAPAAVTVPWLAPRAASPAATPAAPGEGEAAGRQHVAAPSAPVPLTREPVWESPLAAPPSAPLPLPSDPALLRPASQPPLAPVGLAAGHQLMFMAALAQLPLPPQLAAAARPLPPQLAAAAGPLVPGVPPATPGASALARFERSRWSGDGWLLWRRGSSPLAAAGQASYGGSQAGAVLRYSLAAGGGRAPAAYARLSRALSFDEGEVALGLSARPLAAVPLRLLAEGRVQRSGGTTRMRPAASLVTELPPQRLPFRAEAEIYAQAGYVGGAGATPFFDLQLTAERSAAQAGPAELRIGAGAWAGGQKGAARLDVGPRAAVRLELAPTSSRLALDWRFRVAGEAGPGSGPALTFSAGF